MTTSNTVFPDAAVSEVLNALLALTGLKRAVLAVPDGAGWQVEQLAASSQEVANTTTDIDSASMPLANPAFYDAVAHAAAVIGVPPVTGSGSHERISGTLDASRSHATAWVAAPLIDPQGACCALSAIKRRRHILPAQRNRSVFLPVA